MFYSRLLFSKCACFNFIIKKELNEPIIDINRHKTYQLEQLGRCLILNNVKDRYDAIAANRFNGIKNFVFKAIKRVIPNGSY